MKTTFIKTAIWSILAIIPLFGFAQTATPWYGSVTAANQSSFIVRYKTIAESRFYTCDIVTLNCTAVGSTTPTLPADASSTPPAPFKRPGAANVTRSATGRFIAWAVPATPERDKRTINLLDTQTNKEYSFAHPVSYWDLLSEEYKMFAFSPDESRLVYLDDRQGYPTLYSVELQTLKNNESLKGARISTKPYSISDFLFTSSSTLVLTANRAHPLRWGLYEYDFQTEAIKEIASPISYGMQLKKVGSYVAFAKQQGAVTNVLLYNPATKSVLTLKPNKPFPVSFTKTPSEPIKFATGAYGVIAKPDNFKASKAYPVIIWLHGGPYRQTSLEYHPYLSYGMYDQILETLRRRGFVIVKVDYHGSYGYGRPFAESVSHNVGKVEVADVLSAATTIKNKYRTKGVYLMGNSYGGYLALRALAEKPSSFAGAISIAGVTDWQELLEKIPSSIFQVHFTATTKAKQQKLFDQASILKRVKGLTKSKILLIQGQSDTSVPIDQADILYRALPDQAVDFIALADQDHVLSDQISLQTECEAIMSFLNQPAATPCLAE